ncbi:MAG: DUF4926 domain-containing protein [Geitlerinemataceae cyanobacterium]
MTEIQDYDLVALTKAHTATHKQTQQPLQLQRGQIGTVLMSFNDEAYLIDFADRDGNTFAMETIEAAHLLRLLHDPDLALA